jgi:hypothetical protein
MTHRHHQQAGVCFAEFHFERGRQRDQIAALMIADRAFGFASSARGVHQRAQALWVHGREYSGRVAGADQRFISDPAAMRRIAQYKVPALGKPQLCLVGIQCFAKFGACDHRPNFSVIQYVGNLRAGQAEIDRHCNQSRSGQRNINFHPFQAVIGEQADTVTGFQARTQQAIGKTARAIIPLCVIERSARITGTEFLGHQPGIRGDGIREGEELAHIIKWKLIGCE